MTERERILSILNKEKPDQLPWCADFAYLIHSLQQDNVFPMQYENKDADNGLQKMHRDYGAGFYLQGFFPYTQKTENVEFIIKTVGDTTTKIIKTPYGDLREIQQYSHTSYSHGIIEHLIKDIDDLNKYCYVVENTTYSADYEFALKRQKTIDDNGVLLCYTPKSPLMDLIAIYSGVENLTYMASDDEDELISLLDRLEVKYDEACQIVLDSPAECIMIPENISSECVAPFFINI